ncbi:MAG: hypothetical protein MUC60_04100 [Oscillatoria sp. Prado101]|nr:hypothetical protein [Oscillatoria sp. Prado101]
MGTRPAESISVGACAKFPYGTRGVGIIGRGEIEGDAADPFGQYRGHRHRRDAPTPARRQRRRSRSPTPQRGRQIYLLSTGSAFSTSK